MEKHCWKINTFEFINIINFERLDVIIWVSSGIFITMVLCLPISSTTNDFDFVYTTYFSVPPTTLSVIPFDSEIPSTTENLVTHNPELVPIEEGNEILNLVTHNPELVPIEEETEILNRINLDEEPRLNLDFVTETTEPNLILCTKVITEYESLEVFDEIASTVQPTRVSEYFNLDTTPSTEIYIETTTKEFIDVQTTPPRIFTRVSKTTRTPYNRRVTTQRVPKHLTDDEKKAKYGANSTFKFTENMFYVLCPVGVVAIVVGICYVKRINEI